MLQVPLDSVLNKMRSFSSWIVWPSIVASGICAASLGLRSGYPLPAVFLVSNMLVAALVVAAEQVLPHRRDWNALTDRQTINDVAHTLIENQIGQQLGGLIFLSLAVDLAARLTTFAGHPLWPVGWPLIAQAVLAISIGDLLHYWHHRLMHRIPWLWRIHALHHAITRLHVFKASRVHFTNILLRFLMVYAPLVMLGAPVDIIFWHASVMSLLGAIGHSNIDLRLPSVLHKVFMTPQVHRLHHSSERQISESNYSTIFPLWDIVFGSYCSPENRTVDEVGVRGDPIPAGFVAQFLSPFIWDRLERKATAQGRWPQTAAR